jgi:hypothetical protein
VHLDGGGARRGGGERGGGLLLVHDEAPTHETLALRLVVPEGIEDVCARVLRGSVLVSGCLCICTFVYMCTCVNVSVCVCDARVQAALQLGLVVQVVIHHIGRHLPLGSHDIIIRSERRAERRAESTASIKLSSVCYLLS